jgi:PAS domain S-box-containing protein|uniref:PAS domain S-box protein n=1 Tax=Desulfobacca acetoxidans TaxID=60893 RepID=A0A7V6A236_9BACT
MSPTARQSATRDKDKTKEQLLRELSTLKRRLTELEALEDERLHIKQTLKKAYEELEERIEERTLELVRANENLKEEIEERKRTEEELKRTKEYLENVIDNSVDAIGIVDRHGRFILWNRRAAEIYGYRFDELAGKSAFELYADEEDLGRMLAALRREGVVREYEIAMKKKDGSIVLMDISISLLKEDGATIGSVCVARDLSERQKHELELKRARDELSRYSLDLERQVQERTRAITSILRYTPAVVYLKDRQGRYNLVNPRYEELFGVTNKDVQGKSDHDIFPRDVADQFFAHDLKVLEEGQALQVEERIPLADGVHTYLSVKFPIYNAGGATEGLCGIATDITEIKKAQQQLRLLSGSIMAGQEKERKAIARELHDELGQILTALRMDAVWLSDYLKGKNTQAAQRARSMCQLIDKSLDEVRGLATRLRPGMLDDFGLIDALEWFTKDFAKRTGIATTFTHPEMSDVDSLVATAAYRIAQEALTNVARHSYATRVAITMQVNDGTMSLAVTDNGRGFNPKDLRESECLGLAGMRERAALLGGSLEMHSKPGGGTRVDVRLPLMGQGGVA